MQTIGERLEEARKKKGISIREAAEATKIRGDYLQKFESNHFDIGLTEIYTRGFLRTYANFLKLPADRILNDYAALGRGETRPRTPSREIYGRMDISVASAGESNERAAPPEEGAAADAAAARPAQARSRSATSLPTGPDPAVIFRYLKWGGGVIIALIIVLIIKSIFSDGPGSASRNNANAGAPPSQQPAQATAGERTLTLHALDAVLVRVNRKIGQAEGEELFNGALRRGESRTVSFPGPIFISFSAGENLQLEYKGTRYPTGMTGSNRLQME
jgi:cytoskeleton protein RodZ